LTSFSQVSASSREHHDLRTDGKAIFPEFELYKLEQRYTKRKRRTTFISDAVYVEYVLPRSYAIQFLTRKKQRRVRLQQRPAASLAATLRLPRVQLCNWQHSHTIVASAPTMRRVGSCVCWINPRSIFFPGFFFRISTCSISSDRFFVLLRYPNLTRFRYFFESE
jgi:hypothetical protein